MPITEASCVAWFCFIIVAVQSLQAHYPLDSACCLIVGPKGSVEAKFMVVSAPSFCYFLAKCKNETEGFITGLGVLIGNRSRGNCMQEGNTVGEKKIICISDVCMSVETKSILIFLSVAEIKKQ